MTPDRGVGARLEVEDVTVRFAGVVALADVGFVADPGQIHAVIGPNGAGKSTLFNVLCGIYRPVGGSVRLDGQQLVGLSPERVARLGVGRAFQNGSMFAGLTVEENLLLGRHRLTRSGVFSTGLRLGKARREEAVSKGLVRDVAGQLGIEDLLGLPAAELPYGLQKRVDIARALCTEPSLLLLDEPAAGMHTHEKVQMRESIRRIASELGITVLLVEHDMGLVMGISDHVTVLDFGTVIASAAPAAVRRDERVIQAYLGTSSAPPERLLGAPNGNAENPVR
ncbi:MAG: ABC transporter ATP-binding protein [Nocardioidaceae bacterium]